MFVPVFSRECPVKCQCTSTKVKCVNVNFIVKTDLTQLPMNTTYLDLSRNQIESISIENFRNFTKLSTLTLNDNKIKELPKKLDEYLPSLKKFYLAGNKIEFMSIGSLSSYKNLIILDISRNAIRELPSKAFSYAYDLEQLRFSFNSITFISRYAFTNLSNLKYLYLNKNNITFLHSGVFDALHSLQKIYLSDNYLERIRNDLFSPLSNFYGIYLQNNRINALDSRCFQNMQINNLNLQNNQIKSFKGNIFKFSVIHGKINLEDNPLHCTLWLLKEKILVDFRQNGVIQGTCASPSHHKGRSISSLSEKDIQSNATSSCKEHKCQNSAVCDPHNLTTYTCQCTSQFSGQYCGIKIEEIDNTVLIAVCTSVGVFSMLLVIITWYVRYRRRNNNGRCINKEALCCGCILLVMFLVFSLVIGLKVACDFHEYC